jgi:hypothetical protein
MSPEQFAQQIKTKYPEYKNTPDAQLTELVLKKYPQYQSQVVIPKPTQATFGEKTASVLDTVFGGGTIGDAIGTQIAKGTFGNTVQKAVIGRDLSPEEEALVADGPTGKQVAGDALRVGATFMPVGKIAQGASAGLNALGVGARTAQIAGGSIAGGAVGLAADTGLSMSEGGGAKVGLGTAVGAGLPILAPISKAITRGLSKFGGKVGAEVQGAITGTSAETIEQAFLAAKKGGKELDTFTSALRGKTTPEQLVNQIRDNVSVVNTQRQQMFRNTLAEFGDVVLDTTPAKQGFVQNLQQVGIEIAEDGTLNFDNNKLRLVPAAQTKIQQAFTDLMNTPAQSTLVDVDTTRQALKALSMAGDDPSANLANKLLDDAVRSVRNTASQQVPEYGQMLNQFAETSEFLDEITRGLSTGDKATVDQTYRRMATALKTNNEARLSLLQELDEVTDGAILSSISGQQLSETLPRGIFRQIAAGIAGGSVLTGGAPSGLIAPLVLASPRVTGEVVRALGLATAQTEEIIKAISQARNLLIKAGAITGAINDESNP